MARNPRVIVIDQDQIARSEVQKMLALSGFAVLGEAGYGIEAVSLAKEAEPDVIVVAVEDPIVRALQTVEAVARLVDMVVLPMPPLAPNTVSTVPQATGSSVSPDSRARRLSSCASTVWTD